MKKLLKEPLLHFLLLGAALFLVSGWIGSDESVEEAREIVISQGQILILAEQFKKVWQRPPTDKELDGLVDNHVREEVLYRQALALGLDENDPMVRRRMSQKLQFISEDIIDQVEPGEADLEAYLKSHADAYRLDSSFTIRQVYFNADKRGENLEADVETTQAKLQSAGEAADISEAGDSLMLPADHESVSRGDLARQFGEGFADALLTVPTGEWHGPLRSGFGVHLVFISERIDGRLPALNDVRDAVTRDWSAAKRKESNDALYDKWRESYTITIEELSPSKEDSAQ